MSRHQAILNFKFPDDVIAGLDQFEKELRQYHAITGKHIDEDTKSGVILGALAKSSNEKHRDLANHFVLNSYRLDSYNKMFVEIREMLGTKKYMNQESVINAVSKTKGGGKGGKGKKGGKSDSKGQITIKFAGECWVCGRPGHKQSGVLVQSEPEVESQGCSEVDYGGQVGEVRALRDQGSQAIGVSQAQG